MDRKEVRKMEMLEVKEVGSSRWGTAGGQVNTFWELGSKGEADRALLRAGRSRGGYIWDMRRVVMASGPWAGYAQGIRRGRAAVILREASRV